MILGIISDSHDNIPKLKKAISLFNKKNVNLVLHAGDYIAPFSVVMMENNLKCEYLGVFGNNDGEKKGLTKNSQGKISNDFLELDKFSRKIFLTHDISKARIDFSHYDIIISGHTHKDSIEKRGHTWFVNPGECGGWLSGKSSVAIFDLIGDTVKIHRL
ncbi:MAG: metallophosphoesterase [Candidatus Omnitrophica bacterium]|nr:metallophosphoesterase [Candidatus Omnitrophota bacterium]MDD5352899.1 metallophosphoesterase [Candidatus Omnitrophota bacterium]MDD5550498.1 metallophosphoesterase [Candidatus Omnitrophota bacterium]